MGVYPNQEKSRVILIGTSDYEHSSHLAHLPGVHNNLVALEHALTNPETGVFSYQNCTVVDNPDTARSLTVRLKRAANQAEDVLFVYYAGHGILGGRNGDLYLTVRETDEDNAESTAVPFDVISHLLEESPARTRVLVLDCCFSGRAIGAMSSTSAALEKIQVSGTFILTSTEANREARALPNEKYTAFTGELLNILNNGISGGDGELLLGQLYRPLQAAMARRDLPRPKLSIGDTSGDLILKKASRPNREAAHKKETPMLSEVSPPPLPSRPTFANPEVNPTPPPSTAPPLSPRTPVTGYHPPMHSNNLSIPQMHTGQVYTGPSPRPIISDSLARGIRSGLVTTTLWILTVVTFVLLGGCVGVTVTGGYPNAGTAAFSLVLFTTLFSACTVPLFLRYRRRAKIRFQQNWTSHTIPGSTKNSSSR